MFSSHFFILKYIAISPLISFYERVAESSLDESDKIRH